MSDMAYIAVRQNCDCVVAAMVDKPEHAKEHSREIAKLIRQGYRILHVTVEEARERTWAYPCEHEIAAAEKAKRETLPQGEQLFA